jgi:hypothetical protein
MFAMDVHMTEAPWERKKRKGNKTQRSSALGGGGPKTLPHAEFSSSPSGVFDWVIVFWCTGLQVHSRK